jgi:hypothetical protein
MSKIIRLTEADLTRIVKKVMKETRDNKRVISEQDSTDWAPQVDEMGKKIANKLKGTQVCAEDDSDKYNYRCHFITGYESSLNPNRVTSPNLIPRFNLRLTTDSYDDSNKLSKGEISFTVELKNGSPVGVDSFFTHYGDATKLLKDGEYQEKLLSKIQNIRITKPANPCFKGWKFNPHFTYGVGNKVVVNDVQAFSKTINGKEVRIYKDMGNWGKGTGHIDNPNSEYDGKPDQKINWSCSGGKLTITPVNKTTTPIKTTTPVKPTSESLDFKCLVNAGFTKVNKNNRTDIPPVYEKRIGDMKYQFETNKNEVTFYNVKGGSAVKKGKWKCDPSSTSPIKGVKLYDVK